MRRGSCSLCVCVAAMAAHLRTCATATVSHLPDSSHGGDACLDGQVMAMMHPHGQARLASRLDEWKKMFFKTTPHKFYKY